MDGLCLYIKSSISRAFALLMLLHLQSDLFQFVFLDHIVPYGVDDKVRSDRKANAEHHSGEHIGGIMDEEIKS